MDELHDEQMKRIDEIGVWNPGFRVKGSALYWVAVKELKLSHHNGYIFPYNEESNRTEHGLRSLS